MKFGPIYNGVSLLDPRMEPFYRFCVRHNLPLTMHMGTTYARNAPVELGRPIYVEEIALRHPELKMVMAHMGHPWYEECIVIARKQPNVYCEVSALFYRPWQFYNILICGPGIHHPRSQQDFLGHRLPLFRGRGIPGGTARHQPSGRGHDLPRVAQVTIDGIIHSDPFAHWWHAGHPG